MKNKGQSAIEWLVTYGWIMIIILITIYFLAVLGVFGDSNNEQELYTYFKCEYEGHNTTYKAEYYVYFDDTEKIIDEKYFTIIEVCNYDYMLNTVLCDNVELEGYISIIPDNCEFVE